MKWFDKFSQSVKHHLKKNASFILEGIDKIPSGSSKKVKDEQARWIKTALERLDTTCDEKTRNQILVDTCPHAYPKTRIKQMRAEFERLDKIEDLLELMRKDTSWAGGSFYDYSVRKDDEILITKVPYNPKAFEKATNDEEKHNAYCHCGLVKHSKEQISPTFCCCSGGWVKQLWEGIFEQPVEVRLVESLLLGDVQCTHAVRIPGDFL